MVIWVTFLLRVIYILLIWLGIFVLGILGYGIGSSWILWKKVIYKYIKNTNKKIIPVLERNLGMGFDSLGVGL